MTNQEWRSGQKMPPAKRKQIEELAQLGLTGSEIARRAKCGVTTALKVMRSLGKESPYIIGQKIRHEEIRSGYIPGNKLYMEAERLGYHPSTVRRALLNGSANG